MIIGMKKIEKTLKGFKIFTHISNIYKQNTKTISMKTFGLILGHKMSRKAIGLC